MLINRGDKRLTRPLVIVLLCLGLAACGFQLRGTGGGSALPPQWSSMYLASNDPNGELARVVESVFSASGIIWVDRAEAQHILRLGPETFTQRNLSVNAQARAAEFDLQMRADFMVFDSTKTLVMERSTASVNKQMENDPQNVVGKAEEVRVLREELRRELAGQILRRISFFAANVE